jgi:hypothetical protein
MPMTLAMPSAPKTGIPAIRNIKKLAMMMMVMRAGSIF